MHYAGATFAFTAALLTLAASAAALRTHEVRVQILEAEVQLQDDVVYYQPEQIHLSITEGNLTTVTWTTWNDTESLVEFGTDPATLHSTARGASQRFVDGGAQARAQYIHAVTLRNLVPNTRYYYHVGSNLGWSAVFWFRSQPSNDTWSPRLVLFGDMGNANAQSLPRLQEETQAGMYDAIIHVGDFAYDMHDDEAKVGDEFMRQIESVAAYVPYMTCPGNHEAAYNFSNYKARFTMPEGNTDSMYFSWNIGPIHFISIDTEYYYYLNYGTKMVKNQYEWIVKDLEEANRPENRARQPWIIMFGHRPMYCSTLDKDDCTKNNTYTRVGLPVIHAYGLEELLLKYNVDMAFWAHEHDYERLWPLYDYKVMNGSTEHPYTEPRAPVHITTGSAGCTERHDPFQKPQPPITAFRSLDYGYTRLYAHNGTHIEIQQVSDDKGGAVIDHFWVINHSHKFDYTP